MVSATAAAVLDIQRLSTEDGPGLRTTVFFKGCNLACAWCHNPESIAAARQVQWLDSHCIGCRICVDTCPHRALEFGPEGICRDRKKCRVCVACVEACPAKAQEVKGREWDLAALTQEVLKDRAFFGPEGGITCSGGEALLQAPFVENFLAGLKAAGVHTALDTAAAVPPQSLERVLPHTDLVLLDLKLFDPEEHKKYTGIGNEKILANARRLARRVRESGRPELWIRTPVIPGATDSEHNLTAIGRFIAAELGGAPAKWELCSFNNLCADKYARLDKEWAYAGTPLLSRAEMERAWAIARASGVDPALVVWSGGTRVED